MNVCAAKAPFQYETITEMMFNLGVELKCAKDMALEKSTRNNKPATYLNRLRILHHANISKGNASTNTKLATIEYCVHTAIIFNEVLMNKDVKLDECSIDEYEELVRGSMKYFEEWKLETDNAMTNANNPSEQHELSKCFMSIVTYNDLRICVSGFFLYARSILKAIEGGSSSGFFVPVLHSNTSSLEAWFSLVRLAHKDTSCHYITAVSTFYAGAGVEALRNSRNKCYSEKDIVAPDDEDGENAINHTLGRKDCW